MRHYKAAGVGAGTTVLLVATVLSLGAGGAHAQAQGRSLLRSGSPPCVEPPIGNPEEHARLELRESEIVLTNISDRPIVAWALRTVHCYSLGASMGASFSLYRSDKYHYPLDADGFEGLLHPGESVTQPWNPDGDWIRPDRLGSGSGVYHDIGALVFDGTEAVGAPEVIDLIFEDRLENARVALRAQEAVRSGAGGLHELPSKYRWLLEVHTDLNQGLRAIDGKASQDYSIAVSSLRPEDLRRLETEEGLR